MDTFMGFISPFPYTFAPLQWGFCRGQLLTVAQYNALFSLLGSNFGGDGRTNFALPDLQGRQVIGVGINKYTGSTYDIGDAAGVEHVTLTPAQAPLASHTHNATFTPTGGSAASVEVSTNPTASTPAAVEGSYLASQRTVGGTNLYVPGSPTPTTTVKLGGVSGGGGSGNVTVAPNTATSATQPVQIMNPYLALNFCIALYGLYPSRN